MFEYRETEKFDIGAGYGECEYDFFTIDNVDDFGMLMKHYGAVYKRFDYFLDGYRTVENNTNLSPFVKAKMEEHNANLCLTLLGEKFKEDNVGIRQMFVNEQKPDGIFNTYIFYLYYFPTVRAIDYFERGLAYAKSDLHVAAIRHFSRAIKLDPSMGIVFYYRGISYLNKKNHDEAIADFTRAISINSEESAPFSLRGLAYKELGDFEKAKADFAKALELDPSDKMANECLKEINRYK